MRLGWFRHKELKGLARPRMAPPHPQGPQARTWGDPKPLGLEGGPTGGLAARRRTPVWAKPP